MLACTTDATQDPRPARRLPVVKASRAREARTADRFAPIPEDLVLSDLSPWAVKAWAVLNRLAAEQASQRKAGGGPPKWDTWVGSRRDLGEALHTCRATAGRALHALSNAGWVTVHDNPGEASAYTVHHKPVPWADQVLDYLDEVEADPGEQEVTRLTREPGPGSRVSRVTSLVERSQSSSLLPPSTPAPRDDGRTPQEEERRTITDPEVVDLADDLARAGFRSLSWLLTTAEEREIAALSTLLGRRLLTQHAYEIGQYRRQPITSARFFLRDWRGLRPAAPKRPAEHLAAPQPARNVDGPRLAREALATAQRDRSDVA